MAESPVYLEIDRDGARHQYWVWRIRRRSDNRVLATSPMFTRREEAEDEMRTAAAGLPPTRFWDRDAREWVPLSPPAQRS